MPLSWNEIRNNAVRFSSDWATATREDAEAKTFWDEFFGVFGIKRRQVASFEEPVRNIKGQYGYIDLFWPRIVLVEHKSRGKDLGKAEIQAFDYIRDLVRDNRSDELPRYIIVSDFAKIALHDLEPEDQRDLPLFDQWRVKTTEFALSEFHKNIHAFAFIPGYKQHTYEAQDPINIEAVGILGNLHDALEAGGYTGHELERFLVRVLFCLFAEDTGIFEREAFHLYLENNTKPDGSDLGLHLARLFALLNTPEDKRQKNLDESLASFRYVNGALYSEQLGFADFTKDMRDALLACTRFDWGQISPAVFGSLFQAVMEPKERRQTGGHYTSERDIMKVVRSLFLDDLREEFERVKRNKAELKRFHHKLSELRFLDPACGCGNFLVITYRELRLLEIDLLKELHGGQQVHDVAHLSLLDVDAFYGIEILEWPSRIAEVAMWLMDHQMNLQLSAAFGEYVARLPLKKSPTIICENALRIDWKRMLPPDKCSYVLGNPPFVGKKARDEVQQKDMDTVFGGASGTGVLDYVCCWYTRAAEYIRGTHIKVGFVSTNSISQGEQPGVLWQILYKKGLKIHFAHRTFAWESEARGKAHVHVVIIGFGAFDITGKRIFDYEAKEQITVTDVSNISPYLIAGNDVILENRERPLCAVPDILFGNMPNDDGHFLLNDEQKHELIKSEPNAKEFIRSFLSAKEYLHGENRWCLWLKDSSPRTINELALVRERVAAVKKYREASKREATKKLAKYPYLFGEIRQPVSAFVLIPRHSSENRRYIPLSYFSPKSIIGDSCMFVPNANLYHFGILSSTMHMSWVRQVCGRLESRYRYSAKLVYNNYPWPENPTPKQRKAVEDAAQAVLDERKKHTLATLADLYDPLTMPPGLVKAHAALDRAVDHCYRPQVFDNERKRVEYLFWLYGKLTSPLEYVDRRKRPR
ncbi:MAG: class I SAM-dependent DNA methyltransferase [Rhodocyclaceae bacterium]|nr:class I SAM-dependent DNA methyltransferase [Rhodocyclaceae bacterium]